MCCFAVVWCCGVVVLPFCGFAVLVGLLLRDSLFSLFARLYDCVFVCARACVFVCLCVFICLCVC